MAHQSIPNVQVYTVTYLSDVLNSGVLHTIIYVLAPDEDHVKRTYGHLPDYECELLSDHAYWAGGEPVDIPLRT